MLGPQTIKMMRLYASVSYQPMSFFAGMFRVTPDSFFDEESVELDVVRSDQSIAITVQDVSAGYRFNAEDLYNNKKITPPAFKESFTVNAFTLLKRDAGQNPFSQGGFRVKLIAKVFSGAGKISRKIRRANELQAAQVMQEGRATFRDETGKVLYTLNYQPSVTHFPTAAVAWDQPTANPMQDIEQLADVNLADGGADSDKLVFGHKAWAAFSNNAEVLKRLDIANLHMGSIQMPTSDRRGGKFHGRITIGTRIFELWTYPAVYEDPQTGVKTSFMHPSKVVVMSTESRLDALFGGIPNIGEAIGDSTRAQYLPELPARLSSVEDSYDMHFNVWMDERKENLFAGAGSRPVFVPTALDTFGTLNTGIA